MIAEMSNFALKNFNLKQNYAKLTNTRICNFRTIIEKLCFFRSQNFKLPMFYPKHRTFRSLCRKREGTNWTVKKRSSGPAHRRLIEEVEASAASENLPCALVHLHPDLIKLLF